MASMVARPAFDTLLLRLMAVALERSRAMLCWSLPINTPVVAPSGMSQVRSRALARNGLVQMAAWSLGRFKITLLMVTSGLSALLTREGGPATPGAGRGDDAGGAGVLAGSGLAGSAVAAVVPELAADGCLARSPQEFCVMSPSRRPANPQEGETGPLCCSAAADARHTSTTTVLRRQESMSSCEEAATFATFVLYDNKICARERQLRAPLQHLSRGCPWV